MSQELKERGNVADMRLFNTGSGQVEAVSNSRHLGIYVCGITPSAAAHVGHAMVYLTYDLLVRRLRDRGRDASLVRNVTDVDDSILHYALEHDLDYMDLAVSEEARFTSDMAQLNIAAPDSEPHATRSIPITVELIQELRRCGLSYTVDGDIYFDTAALGTFGRLPTYPHELLLALAAARGDDSAKRGKRHPFDFVLWKTSSLRGPHCDTELGAGRPGWHVGCAAVTLGALGPTVDVHGGGTDLVFPHHECKRSIAEVITGKPFVKHWVHTSVVTYAGEKMSKSLGNLVFVRDILQSCEPMVLRVALISHHYRNGFEWSPTTLNPAREVVARLRAAMAGHGGADPRPFIAEVRAALDDDLNAPRALRAVTDLADSINRGGSDEAAIEGLRTCCGVLGIELSS
jgi:L-cysteine:1D-myo-inositol 2-amino-2-deoxy-alpha-D-glucopyranoside ligase